MAEHHGRKFRLHINKAAARAQGSRNHQEDQFSIYDSQLKDKGFGIYSVFDGHGTDQYSIHAAVNMCDVILKQPEFNNHQYVEALQKAFHEENELLRQNHEKGIVGGTTATVALFAEGMLYLANVGDSRSVLGIQDRDKPRAIRLSKDHSFTDRKETERIIESGGNVSGGRVRQNGHGINMTRALGDFDFKQPYNHAQADFISAVPHITSIPLSPLDNFLVLASDGLWGALEDQELVNLVEKSKAKGQTPQQIVENIVSQISHMQGSDNVTVILLMFEWQEIPGDQTPVIETTPTMRKLKNEDVEVYTPVHMDSR